MKIPHSLNDITSEWLIGRLRSAGLLRDACIANMQIIPFDEGIVGQIARMKLTYDIMEPDAPESIIVKLGPDDPDVQAHFFDGGFVEHEVQFYQQLATDISMPTPACYYANINPQERSAVLLLEDIGPALSLEWELGCTLDQAHTAIIELATLHAHWWNKPQLNEIDWLHRRDMEAWHTSFPETWRQSDVKLRNVLPDHVSAIGDRLAVDNSGIFNQWSKTPHTLLHGDYHFQNLLFAPDKQDAILAIVDWSQIGAGPGLHDLSYFVLHSLTSADRKGYERDLVHLYHETLLKGGVSEYDFETCWKDYRLWTLFLGMVFFTLPARAYSIIEFSDILIDRYSSAIIDLDLEERLV